MVSKVVKNKVRSKPPLEVDFTSQFHKDWQDLVRSGKCNMGRLKALMMAIIADDGPLEAIHLEHELSGRWEGFHECHMGGDVLLIYERSPTRVVFVRTGSHAKLFEN